MENERMNVYQAGNIMKCLPIFLTALAAAFYLGSLPLFAQHGAGGAHGGGSGLGSPGPSASRDDGAKGSKSEAGSGTHSSAVTVAQHLKHNTKLAQKLENLLGLSGQNALSQLQSDATGFNNLGQFVAAVHVSHNLEIPFDQLKAKVVGPPAETLGKAIQFFKPEANSKAETRKARKQADNDVKESESES